MHKATERFWHSYHALPANIKKIADKNFDLLKKDRYHPSLQFKKAGKFWSARVSLSYRALAVEDGKCFIWVWIGTHKEYEKLLGKSPSF